MALEPFEYGRSLKNFKELDFHGLSRINNGCTNTYKKCCDILDKIKSKRPLIDL